MNERDSVYQAMVKVWRVDLLLEQTAIVQAQKLLSSDELARAARFSFAIHARRFVAARAALRRLLSYETHTTPNELVFRYTSAGKPELAFPADAGYTFSLAHSGDTALIAVTRGVRLGVDLEQIEVGRVDIASVMRSLHPSEREAIRDIPEPQRAAAFYRCWVRKEALLKGLGSGLLGGLDRFAVSVDETARLLWADPALVRASDWSLLTLDEADYVSALALEGAATSLSGILCVRHIMASEGPPIERAL
jgi:4'-phosphopantetheinyl transferase